MIRPLVPLDDQLTSAGIDFKFSLIQSFPVNQQQIEPSLKSQSKVMGGGSYFFGNSRLGKIKTQPWIVNNENKYFLGPTLSCFLYIKMQCQDEFRNLSGCVIRILTACRMLQISIARQPAPTAWTWSVGLWCSWSESPRHPSSSTASTDTNV